MYINESIIDELEKKHLLTSEREIEKYISNCLKNKESISDDGEITFNKISEMIKNNNYDLIMKEILKKFIYCDHSSSSYNEYFLENINLYAKCLNSEENGDGNYAYLLFDFRFKNEQDHFLVKIEYIYSSWDDSTYTGYEFPKLEKRTVYVV